jgi:hypothetical protein
MKHEEIQDLLEDYVDDKLDRETRKLVDDHLKTCAECRQILDEVAPVDISALGKTVYDERAMRRTIRRSMFRTAWNTVLLVIVGWLAIWFVAALVVQPLVVNRGGRAADAAQASIDLGIMLNPGAVLTEGSISSSLLSRQVDLEFALPVGGSLEPAFSEATDINLFGVRDRPGFNESRDFGQFQGEALEQLSNLGESTVATVSLWFDSPVSVQAAQSIADDTALDFRVVWAGFDTSLGRSGPSQPLWTAGGTLGYATCQDIPGHELGDDLLGATSAGFSQGSGFLFGRPSIDAARNSVVVALTNIASRDELVDYVVPPGDSGDDIEEIIQELENDPEVSMVVVTGPSTAIAEYLESEPGVSANVLAVAFYNWSDGICRR